LHGLQALHDAAQGLHAPHALQAANAGVAEPIAATTANGRTVEDISRARVDFTFFTLSLPWVCTDIEPTRFEPSGSLEPRHYTSRFR
jgi:hypothetical protein